MTARAAKPADEVARIVFEAACDRRRSNLFTLAAFDAPCSCESCDFGPSPSPPPRRPRQPPRSGVYSELFGEVLFKGYPRSKKRRRLSAEARGWPTVAPSQPADEARE